jgi:hypothetical protein
MKQIWEDFQNLKLSKKKKKELFEMCIINTDTSENRKFLEVKKLKIF